jgi:CheY-like chemotaxis protein
MGKLNKCRSARSEPTILVVDDDADSREALACVLAQQGCAILQAANGRQALDLLASHARDIKLILLDLHMPIMNGWEFMTHLRQHNIIAPKIIVISGQAPMPLLGVEAVLQKPIDVPQLLSLMQQL